VRVAMTGSHGLIGGALVEALSGGGHDVTRLVRGTAGPGEVAWDPTGGTIDAARLEGHDAVVNLAGPGIGDRRWDADRKAAIRDSRVDGTGLLARTLASLERPPRVLASGSAVGFYGDRGDEELTEASTKGDGFLADVVDDWEQATAPAADAGVRVAHLRSGVVLSRRGGALAKQLGPFKAGLGGRIGSGRQYLSWITLDDEVAAIVHVLEHEDLRGPVNLTAPGAVTNAEFTRALGAALHRPTLLPVPMIALNLIFGSEMVREMLLGGQRVRPAALDASGFEFGQPEIEGALRAVLGAPAPPAAGAPPPGGGG